MSKNTDSGDSQILVVIGSLFEGTSDRDERVREAAYGALKRIAKLHANEVLTCSMNYRRRNAKLNTQEFKKLMNLIEQICNDYIHESYYTVVEELIDFAIDESLKCSDLQFPACDILTIIGKNYSAEIVKKLLQHMELGEVPHPSMIYITGNLALVNVNAFIPFSTWSLDFIASVLPHIKTDNHKKLYATAVSSIAESVVEYRAVNEDSIAKEAYSPVIEEIYEIFTTTWIQSKDNKVCEAVVYSLSSMLQLFSSQKLWTNTSRITTTLLQQYKRSPALPRYPITLCISNLLSCAPAESLQPVLDTILHALHVMVWITPDFAQPLTIKNHSEVLRCYDHIGKKFGEKLMEIILRNLRSTAEQDKVVSLLIVTHLLGSSDAVIKPRITELITTLHTLLSESSIRISKGLVKVIVALACKNYLNDKDGVFIEFLVKNVSHSQSSFEIDDLEAMCNNTIYLLSSTVPAVQPLCWRVLLQLLLTAVYDNATWIIARSLAHIISKSDVCTIGNENNLRPESVFVRILALLGSPLESNRGIQLLSLLLHYVPKFLAIDIEVWKKKISELITFLETSEWDENKWERAMLNAIELSLIDGSRTWITPVITEINSQLSFYQTKLEQPSFVIGYNDTNQNIKTADERGMLYLSLAVFTLHIQDEKQISANIERILSPIHTHSTIDLKACSRAIGILSKVKLDEILTQLEHKAQLELSRKTSRFLGLLKDSKNESEMTTARLIISEYYSQMVIEAPAKSLMPKIKYLLIWCIAQVNSSKNIDVRNCCIQTIANITDVLDNNQDVCEDILECRGLILDFVVPLIENNNSLPDRMALHVLAVLSKFKPYLQANEKLSILQKVLIKFFQFNTGDSDVSDNKSSIHLAIDELCLLVEEIMENKNTIILEEIVNFVQPWLQHNKICHRFVAVKVLLTAVRCFLEESDDMCESPIKFSQMGSLFGSVFIRAFDRSTETSQNAQNCLILLSIMIDRNEGSILSKEEIEKVFKSCKPLEVYEFFQIVCRKFPTNQLSSLVDSLVDGLLDSDEICAYGSSRLLFILFSEVGNSLHHHALDIFSNLLSKLMKLSNGEALNSSVKAFLRLGSCYRKMFLTTMLNQTLPLHVNICKCWQLISENENFTIEIMDNLLETIKVNSLYDDNAKKGRDKRNIVALLPLAAISAIKEICSSNSVENFVKPYFAEFFSTLLIVMSSYVGTSPPINTPNKASFIPNRDAYSIVPAKIAYDTLLQLIACMKYTDCMEAVKLCRVELFESLSQSILDVIAALARSLCSTQPNEVTKVLSFLTQYLNSSIEAQRITVVVFCAEVFRVGSIPELAINNIVDNLLSALSDTSPSVRQHSLKGLASISELDSCTVNNRYESVLSALLQGLDDDDASIHTGITMEALIGLSKLIPLLADNIFSTTYLSIAIRIKPYFEKEDISVRSMSIKLFGELANIVRQDDVLSFSEQVHSNFICFLLHLAEQDDEIIKVCKYSLRCIAALLKSKKVADVIYTNLLQDGVLMYQEFLTQITKILASELMELSTHFIMTAMSYSKSSWPEVRAAAALFIGIMYNESDKVLEKISADTVICRLLVLLKDTDASVRTNAAYSMSLVFCK